MYALYYQRDGHPAVPVLMENGPVEGTDVQFGYLIVDSDERSRYETVQMYIKSRGLENVPGQFLLVGLEGVDVEIIKRPEPDEDSCCPNCSCSD